MSHLDDHYWYPRSSMDYLPAAGGAGLALPLCHIWRGGSGEQMISDSRRKYRWSVMIYRSCSDDYRTRKYSVIPWGLRTFAQVSSHAGCAGILSDEVSAASERRSSTPETSPQRHDRLQDPTVCPNIYLGEDLMMAFVTGVRRGDRVPALPGLPRTPDCGLDLFGCLRNNTHRGSELRRCAGRRGCGPCRPRRGGAWRGSG